MKSHCSGIILSGGRNSRMQGINKAFLEINGISFMDRVAHILKETFDDIWLVTKQATAYKRNDLRIVEDILGFHSPLSGIHAGLTNISSDYAFCIGCDTPFLKKEVVEILVDEIDYRADVIVPFSGQYYQPLCAVYSKQCIALIEAQLKRRDLKVDNLFAKINVKTVPYGRFKRVDSQLLSFFNVNSPEDFQYAERFSFA